ncbi:MAG: cytochrome c-type biogenesis protein [Halobacteriales archaeon]|jgi:cytochrome c-type biogenesis protein
MAFALSAVVSAFSAGLATFFAPCAFPLLPGYVGYYASTVEEEVRLRGTVVRGLAGSGGIVLAFGAISAIVAVVGRSVVSAVYRFDPLVGIALVGVGIVILIDRGPSLHVALPKRRSSVAGFALFGVGYAVAATSCFAPLFFGVVLGSSAVSVSQAVLSTISFGVGLAAPLTVTTVLAGIGVDVGYSALPGYAESVQRLAGLVLLIVGVWKAAASAGIA